MHGSIYLNLMALVLSGSFLTSCPKTAASLVVGPSSRIDKKSLENPFALTSGAPAGGRSCPASLSATSSSNQENDSDKDSKSSSSSLIQKFFGRSSVVDPYHLLWSPGFAPKTATAAIVMASVRYASSVLALPSISTWLLLDMMPPTVATVLSNLGLPLLASACCLLQLALNVLSIGCAGFNTFLGPLRPYFMALLLVLSMNNAVTMSRRTTLWTSRALLTVVTRWSVALLPEGLYLFNKWVVEGTARGKRVDEQLSLHTLRATVELDVPTMGCVACINSIDNALKRHVGVQHASASLHPHKKGGMAVVELVGASEAQIQERARELCGVVEEAGFGGCVVKTVDTMEWKPAL